MFISFEGIDGSGKSTQIALLKEKLIQSNKVVQVFREPGGTILSEQIREILLNSELEISPVSELLLFSAARAQLVNEEVIPALDRGEVVILDRFYDSTTAYQGYGRESLSIDQIRVINKVASYERKPDFTFYLRLSIDESIARRKNEKDDRMEKSGVEFFKRVIKGFDEVARVESRFRTIDASKDISTIHLEILDHLDFPFPEKA
ncbi:MAG: dTMP kinase [Balneola sp.]|nr:MAG: dTMP kinase [Balneola sp.]